MAPLSRLSVGVLVLCLGAGCATTSAPSTALVTGPAWLREGIAQGLPLEDPLQLSGTAQRRIHHEVALDAGSKQAEMRRIMRFIIDSDGLNFQYKPTRTLNAQAAFDAREGDCMSYAMLFTASARTLGLEVHFVRITRLPSFWEDSGRFFTSSHIAVASGYDTWTENAMVVDFSATESSEWRFTLYEPIEDETAYILFHTNKAAEMLLKGDNTEAERLLRYLLEKAPPVPEVYNNLGIALMHERRYPEATELYGQAIQRFPEFIPFYSNAVLAAAASNLPDLVRTWTLAGQNVAEHDPAFSFAQGMVAFRKGNFPVAAKYFVRALDVQPNDLELLAWTARAHLSAGDLGGGLKDVERILRQTPTPEQKELIDALKREFPMAGIQLPVPSTTFESPQVSSWRL